MRRRHNGQKGVSVAGLEDWSGPRMLDDRILSGVLSYCKGERSELEAIRPDGEGCTADMVPTERIGEKPTCGL